jgi:MraZ protein
VRKLQRILVGHAHPVEMDRQGRVLVPPPLRDFAGLGSQVVLTGQINKFELWDEARWNQRRDEWLEEIDLSDLEESPELKNLVY